MVSSISFEFAIHEFSFVGGLICKYNFAFAAFEVVQEVAFIDEFVFLLKPTKPVEFVVFKLTIIDFFSILAEESTFRNGLIFKNALVCVSIKVSSFTHGMVVLPMAFVVGTRRPGHFAEAVLQPLLHLPFVHFSFLIDDLYFVSL